MVIQNGKRIFASEQFQDHDEIILQQSYTEFFQQFNVSIHNISTLKQSWQGVTWMRLASFYAPGEIITSRTARIL